jgi:hypothetical protein
MILQKRFMGTIWFEKAFSSNYSLNLLQNCLISVLKIGEKVYA